MRDLGSMTCERCRTVTSRTASNQKYCGDCQLVMLIERKPQLVSRSPKLKELADRLGIVVKPAKIKRAVIKAPLKPKPIPKPVVTCGFCGSRVYTPHTKCQSISAKLIREKQAKQSIKKLFAEDFKPAWMVKEEQELEESFIYATSVATEVEYRQLAEESYRRISEKYAPKLRVNRC